ncbi:hypothetical protein LMQ07_14695, partial [Staphylococcus aureus]|uniref:hypothetical protein n=1 Tax=Staphylococcus aureus TaxID=1280 RepID=UPI001E48D542
HTDRVLGYNDNDEYEDDSDEDDCYFTRSSTTTSHENGGDDSYDASYQQRTATTIGDEGSLQTFPELQIQHQLASQHNQATTTNHHDEVEI